MSRINKWILDDENEVDFEDAEAVNQTDGELNETIITYEGNTSDVQSWTDFIASFVNGMKIGKFFKNLYAGIQYVLHVGSLVNNCVSDNPELPLAAAQGKVLMDLITESNDEITQLKSDLTYQSGYVLTMSGARFSGLITGSSTEIAFLIPFNKPISSTDFSISITSLTIRSIDGRLDLTDSDIGSTGFVKYEEMGICVGVYFDSAINVQNNRPISLQVTGTITFL